MRSGRKRSNRQMFVGFGTRLDRPSGQLPNAHLSEGIGILAPLLESRTVSVECDVSISAVGYGTKPRSPSKLNEKLPSAGIFRSTYSTRILLTMGRPSG